MAEAISDGAIVTVLRPFVRATRPVLDGLRETDPFGLRARFDAAAAGGSASAGFDAASAGGSASAGFDAAADVVDGKPGDRGLREKVLDTLAGVQVPGTAAWATMTPRSAPAGGCAAGSGGSPP